MDSVVWTEVGKVADTTYDGDVSATIESLCREALNSRGIEGMD